MGARWRRGTWVGAAGALLLAAGALWLWSSRRAESPAPAAAPGGELAVQESGTPGSPATDALADAGSPPTDAPGRSADFPILLIGLDAADWAILRPLAEAGELPNLQSLIERGASGTLRSIEPMVSPMLWTTVATGRDPLDHGVLDFIESDPATGEAMPITVRQRRAPALWDLFSDEGLDFAVIAWWASWPVYPARGRMVSDRVAFSAYEWRGSEADSLGLYYPEELGRKLEPLRVKPQDVTFEQISGLAKVDRKQFAASEAVLAAGHTAFTDPLNHLRNVVASTLTYHRMALALLDERQPDLFAVYYEGIDEANHHFAHCRAPALSICPPDAAAAFGGTVDGFYEFQDQLLGELLSRVRDDTVVIVVSDHGFLSGKDRPDHISPVIGDGRATQWHRLTGILLMAGPPILPGPQPPSSLLDVAPTALYLAGLPISDELDGRVMLRAIRPEFQRDHPVQRVAAYPPWSVAESLADVPRERGADEQALQKLLALGYLTPDTSGSDKSSSIRRLTTEAVLQEQQGNLREARRLLRRALDLDPEYLPAKLTLASVYQKEGNLDDALRLYVESLPRARDEEPRAYPMAATCFLEAQRGPEGLALYERMAREQGDSPLLQVGLAILQHGVGQPERAEGTLRGVLEAAPGSREAMTVLLSILEPQGRLNEAIPYVRQALRENPGSAIHHQLLGKISEANGKLGEAALSYMRASQAAPDQFEPLADLGRISLRTGRFDEAVGIFRTAAEEFPDQPMARFYLGIALEASGDPAAARTEYEEAERRGLETPELYVRLGKLEAAAGRTDAARSYYRRALELNPDQAEARRELEALTG